MKFITFFILFPLFFISCKSYQHKQIKITPSAAFFKEPTVVNGNKDLIKVDYNQALFLPEIISLDNFNDSEITVLQGENAFYSVHIQNENSQIITLQIKVNHKQEDLDVYRILPVSNWYTEVNENINFLEFYPDALFRVKELKSDLFVLNLQPKENLRLFFQFKTSTVGKDNIDINYSFSDSKDLKSNLCVEVLDLKIPNQSFSSIIFNQINLNSGGSVNEAWIESGFTHLQVNYIPTITFNNDGSPVNGKIDESSSTSTGFRNTAYPWIKEGKKILLFWQPRYAMLAPTIDGKFLQPFSKEWLFAYKHLLNIIYQELKKINPNTTRDQIVIYLADEVSILNDSDTIANLQKLANYIERELPAFKTLLTYGHYSDKEVVDSFNGIDFHVPHVFMPVQSTRREFTVHPQSVFESKSIKMNEKWMYSVESGKRAPIDKFLLLPSVAAWNSYDGYSWYSFVDHAGSTWDAKDGNRLDYSMYYHKEPNNEIYQYWTNRMQTNDYLTSSLRLKAIQQGLNDAKIVKWIRENYSKFNDQDRAIIRDNLKILSSIDIERGLYSKLSKPLPQTMVDFSKNIRLLYVRLKESKSQ